MRYNPIPVDLAAIVTALALAGFLVTDVRSAVRAVVALVFVLFVPGWTAVRLAGFELHSLTFVAAFVFSVTMMIITSFLMATVFGWPWRAAGFGWVVVSVVGLSTAIRRERLGPRSMHGSL